MASRIDYSQNRKLYVGTTAEVTVADGNAIIAGNVGIGTTSPGSPLDVHKDSAYGQYGPAPQLNLQNTNTEGTSGFLQLSSYYNNTNNLYYKSGGIGGGKETATGDGAWGGYLSFWTTSDGTAGAASGMFEHMRITADGNVGIGTTNPDVRLEVVEASPTDGIVADFVNSTNAGGTIAAIKLSNADSEACDVVLGANRRGANFGSDFFISPSDGVDGTNQERLRITEAGAVKFNAYNSTNNTGTPTYLLGTDASGNVVKTLSSSAPGSLWAASGNNIYNTNSGNVGIGTTNPSSQLSGTKGLSIVNSGNAAIGLSNGTEHWLNYLAGSGANNKYRFWNNSVNEVMTLTYGGNVGIGTDDPDRQLEVYGTNDGYMKFDGGRTGNHGYTIGSDNNGFIIYDDTLSSYRFVIDQDSGNVGIGNTGPTSQLQVGPGTSNASRSLIASLGGTENGVLSALSLVNTSGNDVIGYGVGIDFHLASTYSPTGRIATIAEDTGVKAGMAFYTYESGNFDERIRISSAGAIKFNAYDSTNNTGTPTYLLGTDGSGNVVKTNTVPGSGAGPYLPLSAGSSYPLTDALYLGNVGGDQKIQFQRTGGNVYSIEHDAAQLYFYNRTTTETPLLIRNDGDVLMNAGNVGIGTTSPGAKLTVSEAGNGNVALFTNTTDADLHVNLTSGVTMLAPTTSLLAFGTSSSEKMRIIGNGNVGIGTTTPVETFTVPGSKGAMLGFKRFYSNTATVPAGIGPTYFVSATLNDEQGTTLTSQFQYKFYLTTTGTGTYNSSVYIVYRNSADTAWDSHRVSSNGLSSNHPELAISGNSANIYNDHPSAYGVAYRVETSYSAQAKTSPQIFGSDYMWTRDSDSLYYNDGNVGIGTASPQQHQSSTERVLHISNSNAASLNLDATNGDCYVLSSTAGGDFSIYNDDTNNTAFIIDDASNVGIGTTSPSSALSISKSMSAAFIADFINPAVNGHGLLIQAGGTTGTRYITQWKDALGTERFHMEDNGEAYFQGNVGIGTVSPSQKLEVNGAVLAGDYRGSANIYLTSPDSWIFRSTGGNERMRVTSAGNVGINRTSLVEKFEVGGDSAFYGAIKGYTGSSSNQYLSILQSGSNTYISTGTSGETINFSTGSTQNVTNINVAGTATATNFILSSDETLKDKIKDIETKHINVEWKNFELISEPGVKRSGVIAQELEEKHPEFVRTDKDGLKSVAYIDLLITKIAELEARLEKAGL